MKKKHIILVGLTLVILAFTSCQKAKYCQCFAYVDNEDVLLGDDYYMMEHGSCNDKAKEIVGWGQVTCKEVNLNENEGNWFEQWINNLTNHNGPK